MKNHFNDVRSNTFFEMGTTANQWTFINPVKYSRKLVPIQNGKRKGQLVERWIPEYIIPESYTNPFDDDCVFNDTKKCQLCNTAIQNFGVLIHDEKKLFLVVGTECEQKYMSDDDRKYRLEMLFGSKKEYIDSVMQKEKDLLKEVLSNHKDVYNRNSDGYKIITQLFPVFGTQMAARKIISWLNFQSSRDSWRFWSFTKFSNTMVKYWRVSKALGYVPSEDFLNCLSNKKRTSFV